MSASSSRAAAVAVTLSGIRSLHYLKPKESGGSRPPYLRHPSKEAELLRAVAHQHVFSLLIVIEHHLVSFPAEARLLVAAKRRMSGIGVIAIGPHATGLDCAAETVAAICVAAPDARAEAVEGIVGDRECLLVGFKRRHRNDRAEDLFLKDTHLVMALEHSRLDIIATLQFAAEHVALAADKNLGAFFLADVDVRKDLLELFRGGLCADHRGRLQRAPLHDRPHSLKGALHEAIVDRFVNKRAARAGADLTLVQCEHDETFDRLVEEIVILGAHIAEEDVGGLAT